jgi:hypothetical protein
MKRINVDHVQINTPSFSYLIGAGLGDGCICTCLVRGWEQTTFMLKVKDFDFINKFKDELENVFKRKYNITDYMGQFSRIFQAGTQAKSEALLIKSYMENEDWILNSSNRKEVIRGIFDSEGCVNVYKVDGKDYIRVLIGVVDEIFFELIKKLLTMENIKYTTYTAKPSSTSFQKSNTLCVSLHGLKAINFYKYLGSFTINRKDIIMKDYLRGRSL